MTNNTTKNDILELFPDNATNDISAADMRVYIEAIFEKEEKIIKIALVSDLAANTNIYEGSLVVIYNDGDNSGLYLSIINQPNSITHLIKI